jgi:hypothetical protein
MTIAFVSGLVFTALFWMTFSPISSYKYTLPQNPTIIPEKFNPTDFTNYRLVHACPGREALI